MLVLILFVLAVIGSNQPQQLSTQVAMVKPTQTQEDIAKENTYKVEIKPIISQYQAESILLSNNMDTYSPEYDRAAGIFTTLVQEHKQIQSIPSVYAYYDTSLGNILNAMMITTQYTTKTKDTDPCTEEAITTAMNNFNLMNLAPIEPITSSTQIDVCKVAYGFIYTNDAADPKTGDYVTNSTYAGLNKGLETQIKKRYNTETSECD